LFDHGAASALHGRTAAGSKAPAQVGAMVKALGAEEDKEKNHMEDITWTTKKMRIGDLVEWEKNPVKLTRKEAKEIEASIKKFGFVIPMVANEPLKNGKARLIDGHQRKTVLAGMRAARPDTQVDVRIPSRKLTEKEADELSIRLRKNTGEWDMEKLFNFFATDDLVEWGFSEAELGAMDPEPDEAGDDVEVDKANELQEIWKVKPGDLWTAGDHRILCGDALEPADYKKLMQGEKAAMINTDPPWGVSYESVSNKFSMIEGDEKRGDDLVGFLAQAFKNTARNSLEDAAWYIWFGGGIFEEFLIAMRRVGLVPMTRIAWIKPGMVQNVKHYQEAYELCFYASKDGVTPAWYGDRSQTTLWKASLNLNGTKAVAIGNGLQVTDGAGHSMYIKSRPPAAKKIRTVRLAEGETVELGTESDSSNVWLVKNDHGIIHPTQKPVELAARAIRNSSRPGDIYFNIIAEAVRIMGGAEEFYGSTWTMNRVNVLEMVEMLDSGKIKKLSILTGTYFKQRESSVYAQLLTALKRRGMRYVAFINHTKIALIKQGNDYIVFEGSANFTANPRLENFIIANSRELYEFHRGWMEEMLNDKNKKDRLEGIG
jgi:DNA modification methylase